MFIAKLHEKDRRILAIIDSNLKGKCFTEGRKQLDLSASFYDGKEMSKEEFLNLIPACNMLNMAGENIINLAKELNLIDEEQVIRIDNIPHAQCLIISD